MKLEKWKTSVVGTVPWMVQDHDSPLGVIIGQFRNEGHADIFIEALSSIKGGAFAKTPNFCPFCGKKWFVSAISDNVAQPSGQTSQDYCHHK